MIDLTGTTAREVARKVAAREVSAVEVTRSSLERIDRLNGRLNAFITVAADRAIRDAEAVDRDIAAGRTLPLAGVPLAVKDGFHVAGMPATNGSKALERFVPEADAESVARLKKAGCVVVGKASMHEFAYGFTGQNAHFGDAKNPWDESRVPGGSSSGNGVSLATGMALGAIGGDTGGSIRLPASLCGVVGLKVTYGRVSRRGGFPLSWTMDTVGPMARTVGDAASMLAAMAGPDEQDESTLGHPSLAADLATMEAGDLKGLRVGVPHNHFLETADPEVAGAILAALDVLKDRGATLVDTAFPAVEPARGAHRAIIFPEAAAAHETIASDRGNGMSEDIRNLLLSGLFLTAGQYLGAQQARRGIIAEYRELWKRFDVLATPTSPITATLIGQMEREAGGQKTPLVYSYLDHTMMFNLTGQPAISVPCGFTKAGLPIGLQLVGRPWEERTILRAGLAYESATDWMSRKPPALPES